MRGEQGGKHPLTLCPMVTRSRKKKLDCIWFEIHEAGFNQYP